MAIDRKYFVMKKVELQALLGDTSITDDIRAKVEAEIKRRKNRRVKKRKNSSY